MTSNEPSPTCGGLSFSRKSVGKNTKIGTRRGTKKLAQDSRGFRDRQFKLTEKASYREKWFEFDIAEKFEIAPADREKGCKMEQSCLALGRQART